MLEYRTSDPSNQCELMTDPNGRGKIALLPFVLAGLVFFFVRDLRAGEENPLFLLILLAAAVAVALLLARILRRSS